ncbi:MAG: hypothetical protein WD342_12310 [Verrucomicrobiales bacterium]
MNPRLTTESVIRLNDCNRHMVESLAGLGSIYVQARSRSGGLGKRIPRLEPIVIDGLDFVFDADNGIGFSFDRLVAIHAGCAATGQFLAPTMDFEFDGFPAGISFHEFPGMSKAGSVETFIRSFPGTSLSVDALNAWRKSLEFEYAMCPCCRKRSENRAKAVAEHPLHTIFSHATRNRVRIEARIFSDHVDMTSSFVPELIAFENGFLILTNAECDRALHLDMRMVHAVTVDRETFDGSTYSALRLFDMHGNPTFHFMSEGSIFATIWRNALEASGDLFGPNNSA